MRPLAINLLLHHWEGVRDLEQDFEMGMEKNYIILLGRGSQNPISLQRLAPPVHRVLEYSNSMVPLRNTVCRCTSVESEKVPCALEMIINIAL